MAWNFLLLIISFLRTTRGGLGVLRKSVAKSYIQSSTVQNHTVEFKAIAAYKKDKQAIFSLSLFVVLFLF